MQIHHSNYKYSYARRFDHEFNKFVHTPFETIYEEREILSSTQFVWIAKRRLWSRFHETFLLSTKIAARLPLREKKKKKKKKKRREKKREKQE